MSIRQGAKAITSVPSKVSNFLDNLANRYIVKPKDAKGIGGFVFDFEAETEVEMNAEITDHYAEDNTALQDHIAISPQIITLHGFVGELTQKPKEGVFGALDVLQDRLTEIPAYLQDYTPGAVQTIQKALTKAQNVASSVDRALTRIQNLTGNVVGVFSNSVPKTTHQQRAYSILYSLFATKQIFSVETPLDYHPNMAIKRIKFVQEAETKHIVDIMVTLKAIRTPENESTVFDPNLNAYMQQNQDATDNGNPTGTTEDVSVIEARFE